MSITVKKTTISMTRGDTLKLKINISDALGNEYTPCEEDKIRFAVKDYYTDDTTLILKEIPWDTCILRLDPADTKQLEMGHDYVYDIQITMSDGTVDTFIPKGRLKITEEVE